MAETTDLATATPSPTSLSVNGFADSILARVSEDGFYATFSTEDMDGRKKLFSATQSAELLRNYMNTPLEIDNIVFAPTTISDDEGFSNTVMGVYLIATDGRSFVSSSQGVCKSAATMLAQLGDPAEWGGPLTMMCVETNTAKGRRYKSLKLC